MSDSLGRWTCRKLTEGTENGVYHSHSYYDVQNFDETGRFLVVYQMHFQGRSIRPDDKIIIGVIDLEEADQWIPIGESGAWSWQQGPMLQWSLHQRQIAWNDRIEGEFVAHLFDFEKRTDKILPKPIYAVSPKDNEALFLDFDRLQQCRPGYGYVGGSNRRKSCRLPGDDGVWSMDMRTGDYHLLLSFKEAYQRIKKTTSSEQYFGHILRQYDYWFNHIKFNPSGTRFTVKFRYKKKKQVWKEAYSQSLTCGINGQGCRFLDDKASHVIWKDDETLFYWRAPELRISKDTVSGGRKIGTLNPQNGQGNIHILQMPQMEETYIYDTPYREKISLCLYDQVNQRDMILHTFNHHIPSSGPFRCDLHASPSRDGRKIAVTSLEDGGRQVYLLERVE